MKRIILILALITIGGLASASHSYHSWQKQNEVYGTDFGGNRIKICTWICRFDYNNHHTAQTQGHGFCPMPY